MAGMEKLFEGAGKAMEKVPEIYDDGFKPATQESGKALALIPQTINAALAPLRKWIAEKEYSVAETKKLLEIKLEKINPDSIVSPDAYIAVPTIQAISYCMNSEELRNMYANLLATSMISDKKWATHPSFVEIIKQLSPDEAKILKKISEGADTYPLIDVRLKYPDGGFFTQVHNFTLLADGICDSPNNIFSYIDNLSRLKIIDIPSDRKINSDDVYKELEEYHEIQTLLNSQIPDGYSWDIERRKFDVTQFGKMFIKTCVTGVE